MDEDSRHSQPTINDKSFQIRLDILIFVYLSWYGWGKAVRRYPSRAVVAERSPVSEMKALGYPTRHRLCLASKRVRKACPVEAGRYKRAVMEWKEAHRRYCATKTPKSWLWYACGRGNRSSVAYRSRVDLSRCGGEQYFRSRRRFKYLYSELLPRQQERCRALREMQVAEAKMREIRESIFTIMGIPNERRPLVPHFIRDWDRTFVEETLEQLPCTKAAVREVIDGFVSG